jgi:hypothetical protein
MNEEKWIRLERTKKLLCVRERVPVCC